MQHNKCQCDYDEKTDDTLLRLVGIKGARFRMGPNLPAPAMLLQTSADSRYRPPRPAKV